VFVGTPDSNVASATENVTIQDLQFIGENTQHAVGGSVIHDFFFAMTVGVVLGVYSTIFIAVPMTVYFERFLKKNA
jgi:preprotein translocase subunit SecF